ncbi:MAG TPA: type II secretion system protein GspG, partial [Chthoniobacterales bacterium]|nr:type II secretion system protein GspG [Chthoniobacterales bacterium]
MKTLRRQGGFTLIEIMLVVTIIGLLLGTAIYKMRGNVEVSRGVAVQGSIQTIKTQLRLYESMNGFMPTTEQGLAALVQQPSSEPRPVRWTQLMD